MKNKDNRGNSPSVVNREDMSNPSQSDSIAMFQAITGGNEARAKQYLQFANWNVELAISNWFERGEQADEEPAAVPPPIMPSTLPEQQPVDDFVGHVPGGLSLQLNKLVRLTPLLSVYAKADNKLLPLKALLAKVKIVGFVADVELSQRFHNQYDHSIEAVYALASSPYLHLYRFQFEHYNAALTNFEVEVDGKVYKGVCKNKTKAKDDYDDAIASGFGAYMVEQGEFIFWSVIDFYAGKKEDIGTVYVGNLLPGKECRLTIRYVMELEADEKYIRFNLPATRTRLLKIDGDEVPIQIVYFLTSSQSSGLGIAVDIRMKSAIKKLKCLSEHKIESNITANSAAVVLRDAQPQGTFNTEYPFYEVGGKEFVLLIKVDKPHEPVSVLEIFEPDTKLGEETANPNRQATETSDGDVIMGTTDDLSRFGPQPGNYVDPLLGAFGPLGAHDPFLDAFGLQPGSFFSVEDFPQPRSGGFIGFDEPPVPCM